MTRASARAPFPHDLLTPPAAARPAAGPTAPRQTAGSNGPGPAYLAEYAPLLARSEKMRAVKAVIEEVAGTTAPVLIRGESGVGKDIVARAIHAASPRCDGPFVKVNCAALPAELLESELFGHEKGAFTGAYRRKLGTFEFAHHGTIFLDEIGELPLALQPKLLHVLQDMRFSRIGGRDLIEVDVRVVASTNRDLEVALSRGQLREDLYYRLDVVEIQVPPLRERREEIPALTEYFLTKYNQQYGRSVELTSDTLALFLRCPWPGNVRQLENLVRRLVVLSNPRQVHDELLAQSQAVSSATGRPSVLSARFGGDGLGPAVPVPDAQLGLREIARRAALEAERKALMEVLDRVRWNRVTAARILKISYKTLLKKIAECGLAAGERGRRQP